MAGNKERQRMFRLRRDADPERRAKYLADKRRKYQQDVADGRRKKINDMTERERRSQRKAWRSRQKGSRERRQQPVNLETPPVSPPGDGVPPPPNSSSQRGRGRPRLPHRKEKCFHTIRKLEAQLKDEKRRTERYRKKYQRALKRQESSTTPSPGSRARRLLRHLNPGRPNSNVKKTLTFHFSLLEDIKRRFKESKSERQRQSFCRFLSGKIMKKYKMRKFAEQELGLSSRRWYSGRTFEYTPVCRIKRLHTPVVQFYLRDDNSRMITGKKNTKTANKIKKQRRVLQDTLKNLHRKYESENHPKVSYATFCRLRPFWVTEPRDIDRETCLCKKHENMQFLAQKLHNLGLIQTADTETLANAIVCDEQTKDCFYDVCETCKLTAYPGLSPLPGLRDSEDVKYFQWVTKKVPRTDVNGSVKDFSIVAKDEIVTSLSDLVDKFQDSLHNFKKHVFNIKNQFSNYRYIRENLNDESCLVHIDFSENYSGKYQQEIQSVHFGGSHKQMSLHTGVLYLKNDMLSFCSISPNTQHDPPAIWAHLSPILNMLREKHPQVKTIHFFSDGPCTQYRQKANFYCLCTIPFDLGFETISWHFFESSHGKGAPDGIGGFLKRTADRQVKLGKDIASAEVLFDVLQSVQSSIRLYYISDEMVSLMRQKLSNMTFPTIKGTMRLHQVISMERGVIAYRDISCFCAMSEGVLNCDCYDLKQFSFDAVESTSSTDLTEPDKGEDQSTPEALNKTPTLSRPEVLDLSHVGQHCVLVYDDKPYPGVILGVDGDDVEVKCMASLGKNRFFWPTIREDINIYSQSDILCFIEEPARANRRSWQLEKAVWLQIEKTLDLE